MLVVDHNLVFTDLWTRKERELEGKRPILPEYSAVVFDEGHKIVLPAVMEAGNYINKEEMDELVDTFEEIQGAREALIMGTLKMKRMMNEFFQLLYKSITEQGSSERRAIKMSEELFVKAKNLRFSLDHLLMEMQIEQELYSESLSPTLIHAYESLIERAILTLDRFYRNKGKGMIPWVDRNTRNFWVVPRDLGELLEMHR